MTQAFNLGLLANNVNSSGKLDSSVGLVNATPVANGGTNLTTFGATGNMLIADTASSLSAVAMPSFGFKNRIINGAMVIDQRNAGASVNCAAGANTYTLDRWQVENSTSTGVIAAQQNSANAPTNQGFSQSLKLTVGTSNSATAAQVVDLVEKIEGFNVSDLAWGTANAKPITVSFWVYSSLTGTYCSTIRNTNGRSYTVEYSISSANTWTQISYTVVGDTTTSLATDNTFSLGLYFDLGSGSNFNTTAGAWQTGNYRRTTNQANWIGTASATFYITGIQLEKGSTATSFDYRPYGTELALCQRYCNVIRPNSGSSAICSGLWYTTTGTLHSFIYPVQMRSAPTLSYSALADFGVVNTSGANSISAFTITAPSTSNCRLDVTSSSAGTAGQGCIVQTANSSSVLTFSAEL